MDTRMAAITGTVLVALSLFITTLISQGLDTSTTQFSSAQESCGVANFDLGGAAGGTRRGPSGREFCYQYWGFGPGVNAVCNSGDVFAPRGMEERGDRTQLDWLKANYGGTCFTEAEWREIAAAWCCKDSSEAPTATPAPEDTPAPENTPVATAVPTQQPTPAPGSGCLSRPSGGESCSEGLENCCADGNYCHDFGSGVKICRSLEEVTPTPGGPPPCLPAGDRDGTTFGCSNPAFPGGNPCCSPNTCSLRGTRQIDDPDNPGEKKIVYDISCVAPTPTTAPSPTPVGGSCGDVCTTDSQCIEGSCRSKSDPSDPGIDCRTKGDCVCTINTECTETGDIDCLCLNRRDCPTGSDEVELCGQQCWDTPFGRICGPDYNGCSKPHFKCSTDGKSVGYCYNDYCPRPTPRPTDPYFLDEPIEANPIRDDSPQNEGGVGDSEDQPSQLQQFFNLFLR